MNKQKIHQNESGLASLIIAVLIIIVLSTIVLGFMQIIRREQRQALDRQLSQQAYYAAESAVSDAMLAVNEQGFTGNKSTCSPTPAVPGYSFSDPNSNKLTADGNVKYSCLLINQTPSTIEKTLKSNVGQAFPIDAGTAGISAITFEWEDAQDPSGAYKQMRTSSATDFPPAGENPGQWNAIGLIRLDLVPTSVVNEAALEASVKSLVLYPNNSSAPSVTSFGSISSGAIVRSTCDTISGKCSATINGLGGSYYARTAAYYRDVKLTVSATSAAGSPVTKLINGQVVIDATGKASDVTRRIQARVDPSNNAVPDFALASMDSLCKIFSITPDGSGGDRVNDPGGTPDAACAFNP